MKSNLIKSLVITVLVIIAAIAAQAQVKPTKAPTKSGSMNSQYRLYGDYNYIMASPSDVNSYGSSLTWGGTTQYDHSISNLNGFSIGAGYKISTGYFSLEYNYALQELPTKTILPGPNTIQYSFDYLTIYALHDWVFDSGTNQSYELGVGLGYAVKYRYHWLQNSGGATEEVIWQANPLVAKVRANYNYHFSDYLKIRMGASYEYATSSNMSSDSAHPLILGGIVSGQPLRNGTQDVKVDISGLRINAGLLLEF